MRGGRIFARPAMAVSLCVFVGTQSAVAASLCAAVARPVGGVLRDELREALSSYGMLEPSGPVQDTDPNRVFAEQQARLKRGLNLFVDRNRVRSLAQISSPRGQFTEEAVARFRTEKGTLTKASERVDTPWGDLILVHFHEPEYRDRGFHTHVEYLGKTYVGLSGQCQPSNSNDIPAPRLFRASIVTNDAGEGEGFLAYIYRQDPTEPRILIVTPTGLWLSPRERVYN